ncbi:DUF3237 domain-containing protein [Rhodocytophaga rosea]|uniref:UPF0311 protein GXP67_01665 n=1 Tax=Rhodocytophaga rosea TaxID=2704465 RepID=A0A6C0GCR1_9BACT|nr:DUF3237 domain-containing protein [Rhodocytophaga rosea]QHT65470.1 DUF3237 domain-containing protein [Rhodocytophaga rosea]
MAYKSPKLEFAFEATITLSHIYEIGETAYGKRRIIPITGGTFHGPAIKGIILPGGADYQLIRKDGVAELEAKYALQADDGTLIYIINKGLRHGPEQVMKRLAAGEEVDPKTYYFRTSPAFEVIPGPHDWLTRSVFIGEGIRRKDSVEVRFWQVV